MNILKDLNEMTMKAGNLSIGLSIVFNLYKNSKLEKIHIGDIENIKVYKLEHKGKYKSEIFLLMQNDNYFAFFEYFMRNNFLILDKLYSDKNSEKLFEKIIWFIKRYKNVNEIMLGDIHSDITYNIIKHFNNTKKFKVKWYNLDTKKSQEYDEKLYSKEKITPYKIILENDGNFMDWPLFFNPYDSIKSYYNWLVEEN